MTKPPPGGCWGPLGTTGDHWGPLGTDWEWWRTVRTVADGGGRCGGGAGVADWRTVVVGGWWMRQSSFLSWGSAAGLCAYMTATLWHLLACFGHLGGGQHGARRHGVCGGDGEKHSNEALRTASM